MSETLRELREMSEETLIERHDSLAAHTQVGVNHYLTEYARRAQDRQTGAMLKYTYWIVIMTGIMAIATIFNFLTAWHAK